MKKLLLILLCLPIISFGQNWLDMMQDPNANFYETQRGIYFLEIQTGDDIINKKIILK